MMGVLKKLPQTYKVVFVVKKPYPLDIKKLFVE